MIPQIKRKPSSGIGVLSFPKGMLSLPLRSTDTHEQWISQLSGPGYPQRVSVFAQIAVFNDLITSGISRAERSRTPTS
jgi:hypothetical protein